MSVTLAEDYAWNYAWFGLRLVRITLGEDYAW